MQTLAQLKNGQLKGSVSLKLAEGLTNFPNEIFELADTLELLDLSGNNLGELPADFGRLNKLKVLFCSDNPFTTLPEVLADCPVLEMVGFKANKIDTVPPDAINPNLRWLILTNNRITELPATIGNCHRMEKLMLAGNRLTALPIELSNCRNLALLRISANRFKELPGWLLTMPKLSWLAIAGNPFIKKPAIPAIDPVGWDSLQVSRLIGEGASGLIYQAAWNNGGSVQDVAIKIFKGSVTSDGLPEDELDACIAAGTHPGMVRTIGELSGHPEGKKGLVMELIPTRYHNLGLTPSFASCSRDVFKSGLTLTLQQVINIARTVASVAEHLHSKGIMHSDLYAHNTLIDDEGNTLFGDFGGACFYDQGDAGLAAALQRIEVRAYGCLLDDLLNLCTEATDKPAIRQLTILRDACMAHDVPSRPDFAYLGEALVKIMIIAWYS